MLRFEFGSSIRYTQIPVNFIDLVFIVVPSALFRIHSFFLWWMVQRPNSDLLCRKCRMLHFIWDLIQNADNCAGRLIVRRDGYRAYYACHQPGGHKKISNNSLHTLLLRKSNWTLKIFSVSQIRQCTCTSLLGIFLVGNLVFKGNKAWL